MHHLSVMNEHRLLPPAFLYLAAIAQVSQFTIFLPSLITRSSIFNDYQEVSVLKKVLSSWCCFPVLCSLLFGNSCIPQHRTLWGMNDIYGSLKRQNT